MRRLIIGKNGQVGRSLCKEFKRDENTLLLGRDEFDLTKTTACLKLIENFRPDLIINSAAYTRVDEAEEQPNIAYKINRDAVAEIANYATKNQILLIHYSTDYVFDGRQKRPYREDDSTNPLSVYGDSKKQGEDAILTSGCQHFIFRTSWVYSNNGNNFANTILRLAMSQNKLDIVCDQYGCPTSSETIAEATKHCLSEYFQATPLIQKSMIGTYHLTSLGKTNWYEFGRYLVAGAEARGVRMQCKPDKIRPVLSLRSPNIADRPSNSLLDNSKIQQVFNLTTKKWDVSANSFLDKFAHEAQI